MSAPKAFTDINVSQVEDQSTGKSIVVEHVDGASKTKAPGFKDVWQNKRVILWCLVIYLLPINFGFESSTTGNVLAIPTFLAKFGTPLPGGGWEISAYNQQILTASLIVGMFVASFAAGFIADIMGRRITILVACVVCVAGICVQVSTQSIAMLCGGKVISTLGFGLGHTLAPVYVAEIAPDNIRGICLALLNAMVVVGQWTCSLVAYGTSNIQNDWAWRSVLLIQVFPPVLMFILGITILPESPSWLIMKNQPERAAESLRKFHGPTFNTERAIILMEATIQKEKETEKNEEVTYLDCFRGVNLRRTLIVCSLFVAQQFSGIFFVAGYLPYFFTIAGVANPIGIAQISYSIQLLGNICSWFIVDRIGRRPLVVYGTWALTTTLLIIGGLGTVQNNSAVLIVTIVFMTFWGFLYQLTIGAVAYAIAPETPASRVRQKTYSVNLMVTSAAACLIGEVTPLLINPTEANLGSKVTFVFFALSLPFCIYFYFCLPEMKGRSYLELEEMFQKRIPARKFKSYTCDVQIISEENGRKVVGIVDDKETV